MLKVIGITLLSKLTTAISTLNKEDTEFKKHGIEFSNGFKLTNDFDGILFGHESGLSESFIYDKIISKIENKMNDFLNYKVGNKLTRILSVVK